jgi:photosystem II stability/assembly factor-like uncharacterized protein
VSFRKSVVVMRSKLRIILSLCTFLAIAISSATSNSIATIIDPPIRDLFSLDRDHHWALIHNKTGKEFLFRTTDGGDHWTATPLPFEVRRIFFTDANEGWGIAVKQHGESGRTFCIHTTDSGLTWQQLGPISGPEETPTGIVFDASQHGWVVGEGQEEDASGAAFAMETNDGGMRWTKLGWKSKEVSGLYGVRFYNGDVLAWTGGGGEHGIYELRTGTAPRRVFDQETTDLVYFADGSGVAINYGGAYLLSMDSSDWDQTLSESAVFRALSFIDSQRGCVAGNEMYCTEDGGQTWTPRSLPKVGKSDTAYIFGLWAINEDVFWAVSGDTVYKVADRGHKWTKLYLFDKTGRPLDLAHSN